ncbi:MAG: hypothetical protein E7465_06875 [Ruminococcaceae bacterium]|nr:hypothetical protein [Oscillospiraceae bacterium]
MVAFDLIAQAFAACLSWANQLISNSGYLDYFVGIIVISIVFNKILSPMLHGKGSDLAHARHKSKEGDN